MAISGNVVDDGIKSDLTAETIPAELESSFAGPFNGDVAEFFEAAERATEILFLADNAGELVFDRLLLELLPRKTTTVVVKGGPAINDALSADASAAELKGWVAPDLALPCWWMASSNRWNWAICRRKERPSRIMSGFTLSKSMGR
jgi:hypothetical protein